MPIRMANLLRAIRPRRAARGLLGVDIGSAAVKILDWRGAGPGGWPDYAIRSLPADAVLDKGIPDPDVAGRCIAEAVGTLRSRCRDAVTAVPDSTVMQRTIEMDAEMTDAEVEAQIIVEADRHIPYPLDEVHFDFCRRPGPGNEAAAVQLTVCRREHVTARVRALELAGLRAVAVDVEHHALERTLPLLALPRAAARTVAIVDIGVGAIRLHVLTDGRFIYGREQAFSGGLPDKDPELFIGSAARQVEQGLRLFVSSSRQGQVERVFLAGGVAAAAGLVDRIKETLAIPVQLANPFPAAADGHNPQYAPALMLAAGLAIPGGRHG